jgi:hypothetical protein
MALVNIPGSASDHSVRLLPHFASHPYSSILLPEHLVSESVPVYTFSKQRSVHVAPSGQQGTHEN